MRKSKKIDFRKEYWVTIALLFPECNERELFWFDFTCFQISDYIRKRIEESECSDDFYLESIIWKEIHEREKPKIRCKSQSTTWTSRKNRSNSSTECSDDILFLESFFLSKKHSFVIESYEKKRKANNHNYRKPNIYGGMNLSVIPEHDSYISKVPPYPKSTC